MLSRLIRLRLQWKIWLLTAGIILILAVSTLLLVNYQVKKTLSPIVEVELRRNNKLVKLVLEQKINDLLKLGYELAESPRLKGSMVPTVDPQTVIPIATSMRSVISCDLFIIYGIDSNVRFVDVYNASSGLFHSVGTTASIQIALSGESTTDVLNLGPKTYVTINVPIRTLSGVVGVLSLGYDFSNDKIVQDIESNYGVGVAFISKNKIVSSSLSPAFQDELADYYSRNSHIMEQNSMDEIVLGKEKFLIIPSPLFSGLSGQVEYVVILSQNKYMQLPREIQTPLIFVSSLVGLIALILSFFITKTITGPRERMVSTMSAISGSSDLTQRIILRSNDVEMKAIADAFNTMVESLDQSQLEKEESYVDAIQTVVAALDTRDSETFGHSERVVRYTMALAEKLLIPEDSLKAMKWGALLHDMGKIGIADAILRKPGSLTSHEWIEMKKHPQIGYNMIRGIHFLEPALPLIMHHHEKFDGNGYPNGLKGKDIPMGARIFALADSFDAMTSDRPYRKAFSFEFAVEEIKKCSGSQFDPDIVNTFLQITKEEWMRLKVSGNLI